MVATLCLPMLPEHKETPKDLLDVIMDWQLDGTNLQEQRETRCLRLVYQKVAAERMHQGGFKDLVLPLVKLAMSRCAFIGAGTAVVGQLTFVSATAAHSTFTS